MTDIKRRRGRKAPPSYPDAKEFLRRRREFLALLAKGALGAGVLGLMGCDSGGGDNVAYPGGVEGSLDSFDVVEDAVYPGGLADIPNPEDTWDSSGIAPEVPDVPDADDTYFVTDGMPPIPDDVTLEDVKDTQDWDGPAGVPPMPDTIDKDTCILPADVENDGFGPLPGEAPMPDTIDSEK
ncbi:MAG: hypothetical protein ABIK09_11040 [Pseudomonadota bacterium]